MTQFELIEPSRKEISTVTGTATVSGNNTVITATSGKKIRVYGYELNNAGTTNITIYLTFATSSISFGKKELANEGGLSQFNFIPFYKEGATSENLSLNLSGTATINYTIYYIEVTA
jgi:hypothetical protein